VKRCTQCDFIYEDDQSLCDMDGKELVNDANPVALEDGFSSTSTYVQGRASTKPAGLWARSQPRRVAALAVFSILLAVLLFVVYYALTRQSRAGYSNQSANQSPDQSLDRSIPRPITALSSEDVATAPPVSVAETTSPEQSATQSSSSPANQTPISPLPSSSRPAKSYTTVRLAPGSISAGGSPKTGRAPVIIRLNNGASIRADEAWERKEGIWYRQSGMVIFLRRSRVRTIERLAASPSPTLQTDETKRRPENTIAKNQPTSGSQENSNAKKESRVSSFLKKTGRILKKPFKF
jgi:hypothetical protein